MMASSANSFFDKGLPNTSRTFILLLLALDLSILQAPHTAILNGLHPVGLDHVVISPTDGPLGGVTEYTLSIAPLSSAPFTEIQVSIPLGFDLLQFSGSPALKGSIHRYELEKMTKLEWKGEADPSSIWIRIRARNPESDGRYEWKITYRHADGTSTNESVVLGVRRNIPLEGMALLLGGIIAIASILVLFIRARVKFTYIEKGGLVQ